MLSLIKMIVGWSKVYEKTTHIIAMVFSFFWMRYVLDAGFRTDLWRYVHTLPTWEQGIIGFVISFTLWYHNPRLQKELEKETEKNETNSGVGFSGNGSECNNLRANGK